ncbi:RNA polymerase sigma factor SigF [Streptomyces sp. MBT42]|uniref:RNA polymerase sigma factor SigF n=1 Tax=Streptomyces sp. MBT42 TaxID=1488373 RepID=UPI001E4EE7B1|nr:RNA polymerase sigma factor SigF [Streptomyces sp. MBT42]MCD2464489.1 RNA polymerase sigma factor SigF [Streptomyces sp. MBT42]
MRRGDATAGIPEQQARPYEVATEQADQMSEHEQHPEVPETPGVSEAPRGPARAEGSSEAGGAAAATAEPAASAAAPASPTEAVTGTVAEQGGEPGAEEGDGDESDDVPDAPAVPDPHDRSGARALFVTLRDLPEGSPEKAELRNQLVRMHLPLVEHLARRFRNRGEPLDDLTQVATIGLIKSVDRFDPERGVEFSTYATPTVVGEIKRHFRDKGWAVRVPRRLQELRLSLTTATAELSQQHGRSPTVHELAERLGISEEEVLEGLESANAYSTLSLDVPDTDDESPAVADTLGAEDEALEGVEYRESLKPLLEDLPPREKRILLLRFFGNMTQSQIAQEVGISQMHVSRLLARTLASLREKLLVEE